LTLKALLSGAESQNASALAIGQALGHSIADPAHYDVVVNTGTYPQERAEAVVLMAYLAKFGEWPATAHDLRGEGASVSPGTLPNMGPDPSLAH
jgi:hypothetical protein